jgi:Zn-dependent protease
LRASFVLARPFGIAVGMHWSMAALAVFATWVLASASFPSMAPGYPSGTYWTVAALVVALYLLSVVAHELGHAVVARRNQIPVERITLWVLGGVAELGKQPEKPGVELRVALAGPAMSFVCAGAFAGLAVAADAATDAGVLVSGLWWLAIINAVLAVFNLLPARPLDGGRILTAILWWKTKDQAKATDTAAGVAMVLGWGMVGLGAWQFVQGGFGGVWLAVVGWLVVSMARVERQLYAWRSKVGGVAADEVMSPAPPSVPAWIEAGDFATQHLAAGRSEIWLVHDGGGTTTGVLDLREVQRLLLRAPHTPVGEAARPLQQAPLVRRHDDLGRVTPTLFPPLLVVDGGRVVGVVTVADLQRAAATPEVFQHRADAGPSPWPAPPYPGEAWTARTGSAPVHRSPWPPPGS